MREQFRQYIINLYQDIPQEVYEGLLSVFCLGFVMLLVFCGIKKGLRCSSGLLLVEYVSLLFCSTVIFRIVGEIRQYNFQPFWSYKAIQDGREDLLAENIMNVLVLIPVGLLLRHSHQTYDMVENPNDRLLYHRNHRSSPILLDERFLRGR